MFWSGYPWWKHMGQTIPFRSCTFEHMSLPIPVSDMTCHRLSLPSPHLSLLRAICTFLYTYFSIKPRLLFTPDCLLNDRDYLFVVLHRGNIVGTVRYHFIGTLIVNSQKAPPIYLVDAFCIHPAYRKRGVGSYLLTELHRYANQQGLPYTMFLKEGPVLPVLPLPLYSGCYVYRLCLRTTCPSILSLTMEQAHQWVSIYMTCQPHTLMIGNKTSKQCWKAYRQGPVSILACIQDSHQQMSSGQRMGWVTVWLESPNVTDSIRRVAAIALSDAVEEYEWIWMNRRWTGYSIQDDSPWKNDGGFHWYTYQFSTNLSMETSYGIMN